MIKFLALIFFFSSFCYGASKKASKKNLSETSVSEAAKEQLIEPLSDKIKIEDLKEKILLLDWELLKSQKTLNQNLITFHEDDFSPWNLKFSASEEARLSEAVKENFFSKNKRKNLEFNEINVKDIIQKTFPDLDAVAFLQLMPEGINWKLYYLKKDQVLVSKKPASPKKLISEMTSYLPYNGFVVSSNLNQLMIYGNQGSILNSVKVDILSDKNEVVAEGEPFFVSKSIALIKITSVIETDPNLSEKDKAIKNMQIIKSIKNGSKVKINNENHL